MKKQVEEIKARLDTIIVEGIAENGKVVVSMTGNRKLKDIKIDDDFYASAEKDQILELIEIATNNALENAEKVNESEMRSAASGLLPGFM